MSIANILLLAFAVIFSPEAYAKRLPAPDVKPITRGGIQYSYAIEKITEDCPDKVAGCGDRVFVKANAGDEEKWKTEVYQVVYDAGLERDVQQIFPKTLRFKNQKSIEVVDEKGRRYMVNRKTGTRLSPKDVFVYSGP